MNNNYVLGGLFSIFSIFSFFLLQVKQYTHLILILFIMLIVDYITGITNSIIKGNKFEISIAIRGILKKINYVYIILATISFDLIVDRVTSAPFYITNLVIIWLILNEIISTLSNITNDNIIPRNILEYIQKIRKDFF